MRKGWRLLFMGLAIALGLGGTPRTSPAAVPCDAGLVSPTPVSLSGTLRHVVIDTACQYVYLSNAAANRIEVFSIVDKVLQTPITVGSQPAGFDITPDGSRMYVANSGGNNISVVDLAQRKELKKIPVPAGFSNDTPLSLAITNNGRALFTTTFAGSGFGARMMQLDLTTEAVSQRTDFWLSGTTTEATFLSPSTDRSRIAIVAGDISSGPVFVYTSATNAFSPEKDLATFVGYVATNWTGSIILVDRGTYVLDAARNLLGTIPVGGLGVALSPSGTLGYRVVDAGIDILNLDTLLKTGSVSLGDTVAGAFSLLDRGIGGMAISADGRLLAVITDHGFSLVAGAAGTNSKVFLTASVNRPAFAAGHTLTTSAITYDPGLPGSADLFLGVLLPDGVTIVFWTGGGGSAVGSLSDLRTFRPYAANVSLATSFVTAMPNFLSYQRTGAEPPGPYIFFNLATKAGALADGVATNDEILGLATVFFSFL